jgi:cysteine-rich repeat protein
MAACARRDCNAPAMAISEACDDGNTVDGDGCSADCSMLDGLFRRLFQPGRTRQQRQDVRDLRSHDVQWLRIALSL